MKAPRSLDYETVTITPDMASALLDKHANDKNRPLQRMQLFTGDKFPKIRGATL